MTSVFPKQKFNKYNNFADNAFENGLLKVGPWIETLDGERCELNHRLLTSESIMSKDYGGKSTADTAIMAHAQSPLFPPLLVTNRPFLKTGNGLTQPSLHIPLIVERFMRNIPRKIPCPKLKYTNSINCLHSPKKNSKKEECKKELYKDLTAVDLILARPVTRSKKKRFRNDFQNKFLNKDIKKKRNANIPEDIMKGEKEVKFQTASNVVNKKKQIFEEIIKNQEDSELLKKEEIFCKRFTEENSSKSYIWIIDTGLYKNRKKDNDYISKLNAINLNNKKKGTANFEVNKPTLQPETENITNASIQYVIVSPKKENTRLEKTRSEKPSKSFVKSPIKPRVFSGNINECSKPQVTSTEDKTFKSKKKVEDINEEIHINNSLNLKPESNVFLPLILKRNINDTNTKRVPDKKTFEKLPQCVQEDKKIEQSETKIASNNLNISNSTCKIKLSMEEDSTAEVNNDLYTEKKVEYIDDEEEELTENQNLIPVDRNKELFNFVHSANKSKEKKILVEKNIKDLTISNFATKTDTKQLKFSKICFQISKKKSINNRKKCNVLVSQSEGWIDNYY
ncbi:hypothetical protein HDU92_004674 [Lobulomyces angularis]|nr:hypothetical protein HDU92_004674 [Lobulomyces angularis]